MPTNAEAATILRGIADLLDLEGQRFKPEAYRRAARSIETLTEDLAVVAGRNELDTIPGVGAAIEEKIREYLRTGQIAYYDRIRSEVPPGVVEMMRLTGVGPKTARRFWVELHITGRDELRSAIEAHRLDGVTGIGPRKIELLRAALDQAAATPSRRMPLEEAYTIAQQLLHAIRSTAPADRVEAAGSLRRRRETIGDLDLLVSSRDATGVFDVVSALPGVREVMLRGETKETIRLTSGLQVDVRVVAPEEYGAALQYFTGSKEHNVHLRTIARDRGLKINEYGIFRGDQRMGGATEEEVYAALHLPWIPPELREDRGEIEAAGAGQLPTLITEHDVRGELHWHVPPDATVAEIETILAEARRRRFGYVGAVVAGDAVRLPQNVRDRLRELRVKRPSGMPIVWMVGEVTGDAKPPAGGPFDYLIRRPAAAMTNAPNAAHPPTLLIAHLTPTGSTSRIGTELRAWSEWARTHGAAIEVGSGDDRVDSIGAAEVREHHGLLAIPTGLGGPMDDPTFPVAVGLARRAVAAAPDVLNAQVRKGIERRLTVPKGGRVAA